MNRKRGVTLIELMIVVAIVGILASIAYPAYSNYIQRARRADATGAILGLANAMERYFTENYSYKDAVIGSGSGSIYPNQVPIDGGTAYYTLSITNQDTTTYTLNAAPTGGHATDPCGTLTYTQSGVKGKTGTTTVKCW